MERKREAKSIVDSSGGKKWKSVETFLAEFVLSKEETVLSYDDFHPICAAIFESNEVKENEWRIRDIFDLFDSDNDGVLKGPEWKVFYDWIQITVEPVSVLLIVDVQNDFIDGSLALRGCGCGQDGTDVVDPINRLVKEGCFDKIVYSLDWHPENHISFYENLHMRELHSDSKITKESAKPFDTVLFSKPRLEQKLWPKHCVMDTWGAQLHKDLIIAPNSEQLRKGRNSEMEAYSVFFDNNAEVSMELQNILSKIRATHLFVCGLAYDVCVKATCLDGLRLGYALAVIDDCCRGVDLNNIESTKKQISESGGLITSSDHVLSLVNQGKRSLIMSHQSARSMTSLSSLESSITNCNSRNSSGNVSG